MHPVLFRIGRFELHSYGLMLAISFIVGIWLSMKRAQKVGMNPNHIMDLSVVIIISSIIGARALYVVFHLDEFRGHWIDTFSPIQSNGEIGLAGLTLLGGVVLAIAASLLYLWWRRMPILKTADVVIPAFALGIFFTRIGCFLNGCCFGHACSGPLCVVFPPNSPAGATYPGVHIHPTQLYSSAYGLLIFGALMWLDRRKPFDGYVFFWGLVLYGIARFLIDFLRYYEPSMIALHVFGAPITVNQLISLGMIVTGAGLLIWKGKQSHRAAAGQ